MKSGIKFEAILDKDDDFFWVQWAQDPKGAYTFENCSVQLENIELIEFKE